MVEILDKIAGITNNTEPLILKKFQFDLNGYQFTLKNRTVLCTEFYTIAGFINK
jgi:hypothetical protein